MRRDGRQARGAHSCRHTETQQAADQRAPGHARGSRLCEQHKAISNPPSTEGAEVAYKLQSLEEQALLCRCAWLRKLIRQQRACPYGHGSIDAGASTEPALASRLIWVTVLASGVPRGTPMGAQPEINTRLTSNSATSATPASRMLGSAWICNDSVFSPEPCAIAVGLGHGLNTILGPHVRSNAGSPISVGRPAKYKTLLPLVGAGNTWGVVTSVPACSTVPATGG